VALKNDVLMKFKDKPVKKYAAVFNCKSTFAKKTTTDLQLTWNFLFLINDYSLVEISGIVGGEPVRKLPLWHKGA